MSLKPIRNQDRYGLVKVNESAQVIEFTEKKYIDQGLINGGVYATSKSFINSLNLPQKYSWEKDMLEKQSINSNFFGYLSDSYFIDIGIPADYARAQLELT
jgi:D-glycero-alpha-D-manno-heptose 1-phosphate guanylyltransferase